MQPYTLWVKVIPVHLYSKVCVGGGRGGQFMLREVTLFEKKRKMLRQSKGVKRRVINCNGLYIVADGPLSSPGTNSVID